MDEIVRIGLIGTGMNGTVVSRALERNPRARLTALCDIVPERMDAFEAELGHPVAKYEDYQELVRDPQVQAVFVATPNQVHVPAALAAVEAGLHVLCTKPLSDSHESAARLVRAAEAGGKVNMMSLVFRFRPEGLYMMHKVREGFFGDIYYARGRSIRRSGIPSWNEDFIREGGGAFRDMGVHVLDASWWLMGTPKPVSAFGVAGARFGPDGEGYWQFQRPAEEYSSQYGADDYAGGMIRFENGAGLQVESFWASHMKEELQVDVFGTEGGGSMRPVRLYDTDGGVPRDSQVAIPRGWADGWDNIASHYLDCILDGAPCLSPLRHGLYAQAMLEAVLESGRSGREVRLDEFVDFAWT